MFGQRRLLPILVAAAVLSVNLGGPARADSFGDGAQKFIADLAEAAITSLTGKDLEPIARERRLRALMLDHFAVKDIAKWVLGRRYWRRATDQQRAEYLKLFEDLMVADYARRFEKYEGETLAIRKTEVRDGGDAVVYSTMLRSGGEISVRVDWRIRAKDGTYKVVDILVEGTSISLTQRSEFASVIRRNGGNVEALLVELRKRLHNDA